MKVARASRAAPRRRPIATALALLLAAGCSRAEPPRRHTVPAGAERIYVLDAGDRSLRVIDHAARAVVATVALGSHPHGEVPSPDGRRLYVTTGGGHGEVIAVDTATNAILWRLDAGQSLHTPAASGDGGLLFAPDFRAGAVLVVDVAGRRVERRIPLRNGPRGVPLPGPHNAYAGGSGRYVYQTAMRGRALARIDVATREVDRVYPLAGEPRPAALLADESRIYVQLTHLHGFVEMDLASGVETARVEWPEPATLPDGSRRCHGLAIAPGEREIWAASDLEMGIRVYALPDLAELARVPLGGRPEWIAFSRDGSTVYVTNDEPDAGRGRVSVIDRAARRVVATLAAGGQPRRVASVVVPGTTAGAP
jgi:YVTN family beta-propeller protein